MLKKFSVSTNKISENLYWFAIAPVLSMDLCAGFQDELTPTKGTSTTAPDTPRSRCRQLPIASPSIIAPFLVSFVAIAVRFSPSPVASHQFPVAMPLTLSTNKISENLRWFAIDGNLSSAVSTLCDDFLCHGWTRITRIQLWFVLS